MPRPPSIPALLALVVACGATQSPVQALDLTGLPVAFEEDFLNESSPTTPEIDANGTTELTLPPFALTLLDHHTLDGFRTGAGYDSANDPRPISFDTTRIEVFGDVATFEPHFEHRRQHRHTHTDGRLCGRRRVGYVERHRGLDATPLLDVTGVASGVTVALDAASISVGENPPPPDDVRLLGDHSFDCAHPAPWDLQLTGLSNGAYRVIVYAPSFNLVSTGDIDIQAVASIDNLFGDPASNLVEGVPWDAATAFVSDGNGTLLIQGTGPAGGSPCTGIAGAQIEKTVPTLLAGRRRAHTR